MVTLHWREFAVDRRGCRKFHGFTGIVHMDAKVVFVKEGLYVHRTICFGVHIKGFNKFPQNVLGLVNNLLPGAPGGSLIFQKTVYFRPRI